MDVAPVAVGVELECPGCHQMTGRIAPNSGEELVRGASRSLLARLGKEEVDRERASVVAYLRQLAADRMRTGNAPDGALIHGLADDLERGDHLHAEAPP